MSSEDNLLFSKITSNRSSDKDPSADINNEEGIIDVQSILASAGTISVFKLGSDSALDDPISISMTSMNSSIKGSLIRQSPLPSLESINSPRQSVISPNYSKNSPKHSLSSLRHSLNLTNQSLNDIQLISYENDGVDNEANDKESSRQSLNLTVQSLNDSQLISNEKDGVDSKVNDNTKSRKIKEDKIIIQKLVRKDRILCKVQYAMYTLLSIVAAFIVMIIWYTAWLENKKITIEIGNEQPGIKANSNNSGCPFWDITGDGFCDDEANIPECGYDFKDCCKMENDRTICEDCFCIIPEDDKASVKQKHFERCPLYFYQHLGNGRCDLNQNNKDHYFDFGDCCLEDTTCRIKFFNQTDFVDKFCPPNPCIKSNIFCVKEELGNGICEDYNNGPYCDYDLGDCCLSPPNHSWTTPGEISKRDCCICSCKQNALYNANSYMFN